MFLCVRKQTLESIFQVMRVVVNYRNSQKLLKKFVLHPKSTLARKSIYNRAYPERFSTSSPSIPVVFTKVSLLLLLVQPIKNFWKSRQKSIKHVFDNFQQQIHDKSSLAVKTCIKTESCTHCLNSSSIQVICVTLRQTERITLEIRQKIISKLNFSHKKILSQNCEKSRNID